MIFRFLLNPLEAFVWVWLWLTAKWVELKGGRP